MTGNGSGQKKKPENQRSDLLEIVATRNNRCSLEVHAIPARSSDLSIITILTTI